MNNSKFKLFALLLSGLLLYGGCRKIDNEIEKPSVPDKPAIVTEKFFAVPNSSNSKVKDIAQAIFKQNEKKPFVNNLVKKIGYPRWDKAMIAKSTGISHRDGGTTTESLNDSSSIIYLPFAVPDSNSTSAVLVISELPGDTIYNLLYPQYYRQYGFDTTAPGWNARNMFSMFAEFDYTLFGTTTFKITDERIFGGTANDSLILTRKPRVGNFRSQSLSTWVQVCITYTIMPPTQNKSITTQSLMGEGSYEICTDYWFFDNGGGGGGGTSGGGSTSGGGGSGGSSSWPDQPPCPAQPKGYVTNLQISDPCSPGWVPNPDPIPTPPEPIDSLLKKYALLSNKYSDSLGNLCETQHKERFFNIVGYNNQLDTFRVLTSPSEDEVKPNYYMTGGRILLGSWHYHPKYPDGTPGSWPSGGDVAQLYDKPKNFIMIIDCVDARYALVVEDVGQMAAWKNIFGNGPKLLPDRVRDSVLADSRVYSTGAIYVQMTKDKIFGALGSSSTSGIGLYEATSSNGITFTKIN